MTHTRPQLLIRSLSFTLILLAAACGGKSPTSPDTGSTPNTPTPPVVAPLTAALSLQISAQAPHLSGNDVTFSWTSTAITTGVFHLEVGSAAGGSDVLKVDVNQTAGSTTTTYKWTGARSGTFSWRVVSERGTERVESANAQVIVPDMRDLIEALLFYSGIYSDAGVQKPANQFVVWPEGQNVRLLMGAGTNDADRTNAMAFTNQYKTLRNVSAFTENTADTLADASSVGFSVGTIGIRIGDAAAACSSAGATGCAAGGFIGAGGRIQTGLITLARAGSAPLMGHELGHCWGFGHIRLPNGTGITLPMMAPTATTGLMTPLEVEIFTTARDRGLRSGDTVASARSLGIVK